jgi:L-amino acid N-acyltransferase YncA
VAAAARPAAGAIAIRDATERDWRSIWPFFAAIVRAGETIAYDNEMSEHAAQQMWLSEHPSRTTVALDAGAVVGSAQMHANRGGPGAHIASATYVVDPAQRGRGVGRALVLDSLEWARRERFKAMQFNAVVESNAPALALYGSLGFEIVGTVPDAFLHPEHGYVGLHVMHLRLDRDLRDDDARR